MKSKEEFITYYKTLIENDVELQEKQKTLERKNVKKYAKFILPIPFLILLAFLTVVLTGEFFAFLFFFPIIFGGVFVIILVSLIGYAIPMLKNRRVFKYVEDKYKDKLVTYLMEDKIYSFKKEEYIDKKTFGESKLYGYYNRYEGEDLTTIVVPNKENDLMIRFSDLLVKNVTKDKDGHNHTRIIFDGVFGVVEFSRPYDLMMSINGFSWFSNLEKVELESIEFNKMYKVHTNDQIRARMVLKPNRMDEMLRYSGKSLRASLKGNKLYFGIWGSKMFSAEVADSGKEISVNDFYNDVKMINEFIEMLIETLKDFE